MSERIFYAGKALGHILRFINIGAMVSTLGGVGHPPTGNGGELPAPYSDTGAKELWAFTLIVSAHTIQLYDGLLLTDIKRDSIKLIEIVIFPINNYYTNWFRL